jgi:hypothetical protein
LKKFDDEKIVGVLIPISAVKMTVPGVLTGGTGFSENKLKIKNIVVGAKIIVVEKKLLLRYLCIYVYTYINTLSIYIYLYIRACVYSCIF